MGKFTFNFERAFCDQFVMEELQTIRRLFGGKMVEFSVQHCTELWNHPENRRWRLCTYIVKSSVILDKRVIQKCNWNETSSSNYTHGDFERAPIPNKNVDWLPCGFENWTFYLMLSWNSDSRCIQGARILILLGAWMTSSQESSDNINI